MVVVDGDDECEEEGGEKDTAGREKKTNAEKANAARERDAAAERGGMGYCTIRILLLSKRVFLKEASSQLAMVPQESWTPEL